MVGGRVKDSKIRVGTGCSGTDLVMYVLATLLRCWPVSYGLEVGIEHCFACESVEYKRRFIEDHFAPSHIFTDVTTLHTGFSTCSKTGKESVEVPEVDPFVAGFERDQFSTLNNDRFETPGCLTRGDGKSGSTGKAVIRFVERFRPSLVVLENVRNLK